MLPVLAITFALVTADGSNARARWLAAAAKDRQLMSLGRPQLYGTQLRKSERGKWELHTVDPAITDEERAKWNVPSLAVAKQRAAAMNR